MERIPLEAFNRMAEDMAVALEDLGRQYSQDPGGRPAYIEVMDERTHHHVGLANAMEVLYRYYIPVPEWQTETA